VGHGARLAKLLGCKMKRRAVSEVLIRTPPLCLTQRAVLSAPFLRRSSGGVGGTSGEGVLTFVPLLILGVMCVRVLVVLSLTMYVFSRADRVCD